MKGIVKVFCVHGCIHQIQNYPDQYVNKKKHLNGVFTKKQQQKTKIGLLPKTDMLGDWWF